MDQQQTANQNELLPLLVLAPRPPGSAEPLAKTAQGDRSTMLYRSEFGYDCRYDSPQQAYATKSYDREGPRKSWFGIIALVSIVLVIGLIALQPEARDAVGTFFIGHHSAPSSAPQPTSQVGVLGVSTGDNNSGGNLSYGGTSSSDTGSSTSSNQSSANNSSSATQSTTTSGSGNASGGKPMVTLTGSYTVSGGKATTNCTQGTAGSGICTWTINHTAGDNMSMKITWTGNAKFAVNVGDSVGNVYYSGTSTTSPMNAPITNSGQSINITITITDTSQTNFSVALSNQ